MGSPARRFEGRQRGRAIVPVLLLAAVAAAGLYSAGARGAPEITDDEDWAASPEAYFLTAEERAEWKSLASRDSRHRFQERYWLKRDPSPGSEKNEFRELVRARIKTADDRFRIQKTPGSRTARGQVFIVLGTPARVNDEAAPRLSSGAGGRRLGEGVTPVAVIEGNETTSTWFYETDRTPRILEAIGRPSLEIKIVIEPSLRKDAIQNPGLFHDVQEKVARKSIVNPDLVAPESGDAFAADRPAAPRATVSAAVRAALDAAAPGSRGSDWFANAVSVFHDTGPAESVVWLYAPPPRGTVSAFSGLVKAEDGREVASWSEAPVGSPEFSAGGDGAVFARRLPLAPGSYSVSLALTGESDRLLASATLPLTVPAVEGKFGVSSILLTLGPASAPASRDRSFVFGGTAVPPRADSLFRGSQSLWYFVLVANPTDASKTFLEPRLRRNGQPAGGVSPFAAKLQPIGGARFLAGIELPLATLPAGDYVLYLTVRDGMGSAAPAEVRRAEFRLAP